jgi:hypothetical protein
MNIETLIKETFADHEHIAPDGDTVLAAARQRIDRRRAVLSRPLAVAAGVVALTLVAVTVVALNRPGSPAAGKAEVAGPPSTGSAAPAIADLRMPFSLGWLPPGSVTRIARRINIGSATADSDKPLYGGEYVLTVRSKGQAIDIDVQQLKMVTVDEAMFKSGPGQPVTVNGQRGVESSNSGGAGGYELYVAQRGGGSMYVNVAGSPDSTAPAQRLIDVGRRVAQNIRFPGKTTVTPAFGLRDLPSGMRICAFDVESTGTGYDLGACSAMPTVHVGTNISSNSPGTPGRPVQGHATRYTNDGGYRMLRVLDAVDGAPVTVAGRVALSDLYAVASRLVLPR